MNVSIHKYYIQLQSPSICTLVGRVNGFEKPENVKAGAFWPFLYLRFRTHPNNEMWINHELIHFKQQFELLFIFFYLFLFLERIYLRYYYGMSQMDAYLNSAYEQECYINQKDKDYLKKRKSFAFVKYIKNKRKIFFLDDQGNIEIDNLC